MVIFFFLFDDRNIASAIDFLSRCKESSRRRETGCPKETEENEPF